jgi:hypothetical protein
MFSLKLDEPLRHWRKGRKTDSNVAISLIMVVGYWLLITIRSSFIAMHVGLE